MNQIWPVVLSLSVSGSILALALFALEPFIKKRLSQTWGYYIWLVVIVRLLLPFSAETSLVGQAYQSLVSSVPDGVVKQAPDIGQTDRPFSEVPADFREPIQRDEPAADGKWRGLQNRIWLVWAAAAWLTFTYKAICYHRFLRFVKGRAQRITDINMLEIYHEELAAAKVRKLPLRLNDRVGSPMLIGVFRPMLVIPVLDVGNDELRHIFRHEITHYKRFDYCYKWLVQIAKSLHWFNPLVYRISRQIDKYCELSCDETNIKRLDKAGRESYANALMASLKPHGNYSKYVISMTMSEDANQVKERLDRIMEFNKSKRIVTCATVLLTIVLFSGFTFTGAYSPAQQAGAPNDNEADNDSAFAGEPSAGTRAGAGNAYADYYNTDEYQQQWRSYGALQDAGYREKAYQETYGIYEPYGLVYNPPSDRLYYNDELVKYFEDIWGEPTDGGIFRFFGPYPDGTAVVFAQRNEEGALIGLSAEKYDANKAYLWKTAPPIPENNPSGDPEIAGLIKSKIREALQKAYQEYSAYGLRYDAQAGKLYHDDNLVNYFEDTKMGRYFGAFKEGQYTVYAIRDESGNLTGLDVLDSGGN